MKLCQQGVNPSLGLLAADERDLAAIHVLDAAAELGPPSGVDLSLICISAVVKTQ